MRLSLVLLTVAMFAVLLTAGAASRGAGGQVQPSAGHAGEMGEQAKLEIIRYVDGEFAKAVQPLPHEKSSYKIAVGKPLDVKALQNEVRREGAIAAPGDTVQITKVEFRGTEIAFQINGGGRKKFHWREHLQVGMGGAYPDAPASDHPDEGRGTTLVLDYGRPLPNMGPDQVKKDLSALLDFSKEHSAAVNWFDTLPAPVQQAIREHRAIVGMDQEMVIAALGRPDHKVRERDPQGNETEDWIYGTPPAMTTFVTFIGDKVVRVEVFNDPNAKPNTTTGANLATHF
ncbi:MAG TPA: hypothetical protein VEJ67_12855 [Candidatus Cybelea sp.]|nr:hypothetical protein [Candidatus Cybelea sp.]